MLYLHETEVINLIIRRKSHRLFLYYMSCSDHLTGSQKETSSEFLCSFTNCIKV